MINETLNATKIFHIHNLMTGVGFDGGAYAMPWIMAWVGLGILGLLLMLSKKWLGEEEITGLPWNWVTAGLGLLVYIVVVSLTGSAKWSFLAGLLGMIAGGVGVGYLWGGENG